MATDYRLDPFQDVLNTVNISGETRTIPSVSPFSIRLAEVPLKETPSSISLTIGGYTATEVSSQPAPVSFGRTIQRARTVTRTGTPARYFLTLRTLAKR